MMSKAKYEDRILQLIYLGEANLQYYKQIKDFLERNRKEKSSKELIEFSNDKKVQYFILASNNHFFEAVSIIHSLIHEGKNQEVSLSNYLGQNSNRDLGKDIDGIRKKYRNSHLNDIRDKIADHKDINNVGDPWAVAVLFIDRKWVDSLSQIINELKDIAYKYFEACKIPNYVYDKNCLPEIMEKVF